MLLAIDIGNSNVVIGCLDGDKTVKQFRMVTDLKKTDDEYAAGMKMILIPDQVPANEQTIPLSHRILSGLNQVPEVIAQWRNAL